MSISDVVVAHGILLPQGTLTQPWFLTLAALVAINTVMYVALACAKVLPKLYLSDWHQHRGSRSETRGIYPEGPDPVVGPASRPGRT